MTTTALVLCRSPFLWLLLHNTNIERTIGRDIRGYQRRYNKQRQALLRETPLPHCQCGALDDLVVIDMGSDHKGVMRSFQEIRARGEPRWWLYVAVCRVCEQGWLVGAEERQNDIYCLCRISGDEVEQILRHDEWPPDFDNYETLLTIGRNAGRRVTFFDVADSSLLWTIADLARQRPGIAVSEIASLLNLSPPVTERLARVAMAKENLVVTFA